jgi:hypothetical protein
MRRLDTDHIVMTNREARELQRALIAGAEAVSQLANYRRNQISISKKDWLEKLDSAAAADKLVERLRFWQTRIHEVWSKYDA